MLSGTEQVPNLYVQVLFLLELLIAVIRDPTQSP